MGEVAIGAGLLRGGAGIFQDLETDPPPVTVQKVMGEFLANGYICSDAAVEKVMGEFPDNCCYRWGDALEIIENSCSHLQVDTGSPGERFMGGAYDKQQYRG
jgi:hypothetical protein